LSLSRKYDAPFGFIVSAMLTARHLMAFVATTDAPRATAFYRDTLGLPLVSDDPHAVVFFAGPSVLRLQKVETFVPAPFTVLGWHVPDIAAEVAALGARGVAFERYPFLTQDETGVWTTPDGAKVAWFKDPDGNVLSLTQGVREPRAETVIPEIFVDDGARALAFYNEAFGATEISRMTTPDGAKLVHGEIEISGHRLFVVDEFPDVGTCRCPRTLGGTGVRITLQVEDADAFVARATAAGAKVMMPVQKMFWGARYGKLIDPFGHEWGINQQQEQLTPAEESANAKELFAK
jgi:uncharacterized glyoxalase superfamily protein PhnB